jgi:hypothetical protein
VGQSFPNYGKQILARFAELLERSKANKEKYDRERLESYYRRNFKEYFQFEAGAARARGISPETLAQIRALLEKYE